MLSCCMLNQDIYCLKPRSPGQGVVIIQEQLPALDLSSAQSELQVRIVRPTGDMKAMRAGYCIGCACIIIVPITYSV